MNTTRRGAVALLAVVGLVVTSGCLTVYPSVTVESNDSATFRNVETGSEWGTSSVQATITFAPSATTTDGVSRVNVITESGGSFYSTEVDTGQTSVSLPLPTGTPVTLYAVNTVNGSVVATQNVTVSGDTYP
ncbi:hypothetical protein GQS65_01965 [Halomarina oriensis]|uniref:Uncharacterized protein n=1 Tax=Halomarina oriensis TaxID=671145 RepID=A0A6B0GH33_9EURY|nr:hypothetical protein [Halomarina oriensis]